MRVSSLSLFFIVALLLAIGPCPSKSEVEQDTDPWVNCSALSGAGESCSECAASLSCYWCPSSIDARENGTCGFLAQLPFEPICETFFSSFLFFFSFFFILIFQNNRGICTGDNCVCEEELCPSYWPCSPDFFGQLVLMAFYGVILAVGAKTISDGSELLMEILDPGIVGGFVLPVLGAVPDAMIIIVSGAFGDDPQVSIFSPPFMNILFCFFHSFHFDPFLISFLFFSFLFFFFFALPLFSSFFFFLSSFFKFTFCL